jgi:hypothetical protein
MAYRYFDEVLIEHINQANGKSAVNIDFVNTSIDEVRYEFSRVAVQIDEALKQIASAHCWLKPIKEGPVFLTYPVDGTGWYITKEEDIAYLVRHIEEGVDYILVPDVDEWVVFNNKLDYVNSEELNATVTYHNESPGAHDSIVGKVANIENQLKSISATRKILNQPVYNGNFNYLFTTPMKDTKYIVNVFSATSGDILFPKITKTTGQINLFFNGVNPGNIDIFIIE